MYILGKFNGITFGNLQNRPSPFTMLSLDMVTGIPPFVRKSEEYPPPLK
jgi:hypothetical protein